MITGLTPEQQAKILKEIGNELYRHSQRALHGYSLTQPGAGHQGASQHPGAGLSALGAGIGTLAGIGAQHPYSGNQSLNQMHGLHPAWGLLLGPTATVLADPPAKPKPAPVKYTGVRAGEITAWRLWIPTNGELHSVSVNRVWKPGVPMEGNPSEGDAGVYAYKSVVGAVQHMLSLGGSTVCGTVLLWGDIIEHELGYRAQFAKINTLDWIEGVVGGTAEKQQTLETLRKIYLEPPCTPSS